MALNDLTAEQQISKAKVALMNDPEWRWLAGIMMMGDVTFDDPQVPTAATDGLNETYDRGFLAALTPEEVKFVVLHENFHKMFRHLFVWQNLFNEDPELANISCDAVINNQNLIGKPGIKFIDGGVDMPKYADAAIWNAKKIFDDLKQNGVGANTGANNGANKGTNNGTINGANGKGRDTHQWEKAKAVSGEEAKEIEKQVDAALRQATMAGNIGANMPRNIKEMLVPAVDWKSLLAEFVKTVCAGREEQTWRKPHKTYLAYDLYLPDNYSETIGRVLIGGDTSGSISDDMLSKFMGFAQQLCDEVQPDGVDIVWWDTKVAGVDSFERGELSGMANAVKPKGGGGTAPACIPEWIKKQNGKDYVCAVILTDGEFYGDGVGDWGDLPVLWLVVNNRPVKDIPVGKTITVSEL